MKFATLGKLPGPGSLRSLLCPSLPVVKGNTLGEEICEQGGSQSWLTPKPGSFVDFGRSTQMICGYYKTCHCCSLVTVRTGDQALGEIWEVQLDVKAKICTKWKLRS